MRAPPDQTRSKTLRLELMSLAVNERELAKKQVQGHEVTQPGEAPQTKVHADNLFAAYVIAQTIRDGFVFVAKVIRQSIDDPIDY